MYEKTSYKLLGCDYCYIHMIRIKLRYRQETYRLYMNRYIKFLTRISIAALVFAFVAWAIVQEPIEPKETSLPQGTQIPLYIPPPVST